MPIYEYLCEQCKHQFEEWQKDFAERDAACPVCSGKGKRQISSTTFVLKGSGWYVTDYAGKKSGQNGAKEKGSTAESQNDTSASSNEKGGSDGSKGGTSADAA